MDFRIVRGLSNSLDSQVGDLAGGKLTPAVTSRVMQGRQMSFALGQLIYENDQPYIHLIDATSGDLTGTRLALNQHSLKLIDEEEAGRPALYYHRDLLVDPG